VGNFIYKQKVEEASLTQHCCVVQNNRTLNNGVLNTCLMKENKVISIAKETKFGTTKIGRTFKISLKNAVGT